MKLHTQPFTGSSRTQTTRIPGKLLRELRSNHRNFFVDNRSSPRVQINAPAWLAQCWAVPRRVASNGSTVPAGRSTPLNQLAPGERVSGCQPTTPHWYQPSLSEVTVACAGSSWQLWLQETCACIHADATYAAGLDTLPNEVNVWLRTPFPHWERDCSRGGASWRQLRGSLLGLFVFSSLAGELAENGGSPLSETCSHSRF